MISLLTIDRGRRSADAALTDSANEHSQALT